MSLIKNLIKEPTEEPLKKRKKHKNANSDAEDAVSDENEGEQSDKILPRPIRTATDLQRLRLEKLMKNPEKPVIIPEQRQEKDYMSSVPSFVRNVMGSSAGAGSGEFHVYRHLRRKEYARQKNIQSKSRQEELNEEYQRKLLENHLAAEQKTAKKRAKRLKKKERAKLARRLKQKGNKNIPADVDETQQVSEDSSDEEQSEEAIADHEAQPTVTEKNEQAELQETVVITADEQPVSMAVSCQQKIITTAEERSLQSEEPAEISEKKIPNSPAAT